MFDEAVAKYLAETGGVPEHPAEAGSSISPVPTGDAIVQKRVPFKPQGLHKLKTWDVSSGALLHANARLWTPISRRAPIAGLAEHHRGYPGPKPEPRWHPPAGTSSGGTFASPAATEGDGDGGLL